jgi:hypothetical protein
VTIYYGTTPGKNNKLRRILITLLVNIIYYVIT